MGLGSNAVIGDGTQTLLCAYLSAVLLVGLLLNASMGWGWADPVAGLVIAAVAAREGIQAWRGQPCCPTRAAGHAGNEVHGAPTGCAEGCCTPEDP
jgi:hypothetical protein